MFNTTKKNRVGMGLLVVLLAAALVLPSFAGLMFTTKKSNVSAATAITFYKVGTDTPPAGRVYRVALLNPDADCTVSCWRYNGSSWRRVMPYGAASDTVYSVRQNVGLDEIISGGCDLIYVTPASVTDLFVYGY